MTRTRSSSVRDRARSALAARRRELLGEAAFAPDGVHVQAFADALVPTLSADDVAWARTALQARAKGELRPTRDGVVPLHAAWSSTALVAGAFGAWRTRPAQLELAELGPFSAVRLEERLHIPHGGGTPNLDVALDGPDGLVGVEAKLTEHLTAARPRAWKPAYERPAMREELQGGWREAFDLLLDGRWEPRHLDAGQLVRHALSLRGAGDLVYLWWEPADADELDEVRRHREEVDRLAALVGDAPPRLRARTWDAVLDGWQAAAPEHVAALRERYVVPVGA